MRNSYINIFRKVSAPKVRFRVAIVLIGFVLNRAAVAEEFAGASVKVTLRPAGSFVAKTEAAQVKGWVLKKGSEFVAKDIQVDVSKIETGIELRNTHTRKYLEVDKFPEVILVSAKGQTGQNGRGGQGEGVIKIKGIEKAIQGTFEIQKDLLVARFNLKLSDFNITGIKYMGVGVDDTVQVEVKVPWKESVN